MANGKEAKLKADRDRYHDDPERFKGAARDRYQADPEKHKARSQTNRNGRTPQQKKIYLGYSRDYYQKHADELKQKKRLHHLEKRQMEKIQEFVLPILVMQYMSQMEKMQEFVFPIIVVLHILHLDREERLDRQRVEEEEDRKARKSVVPVTQAEIDAAKVTFMKQGGIIEKIPTSYEKPQYGLVGLKGS